MVARPRVTLPVSEPHVLLPGILRALSSSLRSLKSPQRGFVEKL